MTGYLRRDIFESLESASPDESLTNYDGRSNKQMKNLSIFVFGQEKLER